MSWLFIIGLNIATQRLHFISPTTISPSGLPAQESVQFATCAPSLPSDLCSASPENTQLFSDNFLMFRTLNVLLVEGTFWTTHFNCSRFYFLEKPSVPMSDFRQDVGTDRYNTVQFGFQPLHSSTRFFLSTIFHSTSPSFPNSISPLLKIKAHSDGLKPLCTHLLSCQISGTLLVPRQYRSRARQQRRV